MKPNASQLRLLVKDAFGNTVYDQTADFTAPWSEDVITSSAGLTSQHITTAHDRILWLPNNDEVVIISKRAQSNSGCFSSYANGYGIVVCQAFGSNNRDIRLMLTGHEHGSSATMAASALTGSAAFFVD
jgi:hypothetical protein